MGGEQDVQGRVKTVWWELVVSQMPYEMGIGCNEKRTVETSKIHLRINLGGIDYHFRINLGPHPHRISVLILIPHSHQPHEYTARYHFYLIIQAFLSPLPPSSIQES